MWSNTDQMGTKHLNMKLGEQPASLPALALELAKASGGRFQHIMITEPALLDPSSELRLAEIVLDLP